MGCFLPYVGNLHAAQIVSIVTVPPWYVFPRTHIPSEMYLPNPGKHTTRDMSFPGRETHITRDVSSGKNISRGNTYHCDVTAIWVSPYYVFPRKHIPREMCFPHTGTHVTRDTLSGKHKWSNPFSLLSSLNLIKAFSKQTLFKIAFPCIVNTGGLRKSFRHFYYRNSAVHAWCCFLLRLRLRQELLLLWRYSHMCSPEHISLMKCVSPKGEHISLGIRVSRLWNTYH